MRKLALIGMLIVALALVGCSGSAPATTPSPTPPEKSDAAPPADEEAAAPSGGATGRTIPYGGATIAILDVTRNSEGEDVGGTRQGDFVKITFNVENASDKSVFLRGKAFLLEGDGHTTSGTLLNRDDQVLGGTSTNMTFDFAISDVANTVRPNTDVADASTLKLWIADPSKNSWNGYSVSRWAYATPMSPEDKKVDSSVAGVPLSEFWTGELPVPSQ